MRTIKAVRKAETGNPLFSGRNSGQEIDLNEKEKDNMHKRSNQHREPNLAGQNENRQSGTVVSVGERDRSNSA